MLFHVYGFEFMLHYKWKKNTEEKGKEEQRTKKYKWKTS